MQHALLKYTLDLALENVRHGGGPFAALVAKDGQTVATGANRVVPSNDPTAHAEIVAIREACRTLGTFQLTGCDVYCSAEPCPMCLGAIFWARPDRVFFAATREDAAAAGFEDALIYQQIQIPHSERLIPMFHIVDGEATRPFEEWVSKSDKREY